VVVFAVMVGRIVIAVVVGLPILASLVLG